MSEWTSVIAVFWVLWALDGVKIAPRAIFTVAEEWFRSAWKGPLLCWSQSGWTVFARLSIPGPWTSSWRVTAADVLMIISPRGICNRPTGTAGRPTEAPHVAQAWVWEDVREAAVIKGWLWVNGARFCPDTGHLSSVELLAVARLAPAARETRIRMIYPALVAAGTPAAEVAGACRKNDVGGGVQYHLMVGLLVGYGASAYGFVSVGSWGNAGSVSQPNV